MIVARDIERRLRKAARQFPALTLTRRPSPRSSCAYESPSPGAKTPRPQDDDEVSSVHLADMPALVEADRFQRLWAETERQKRLLLHDEEAKAARAKVTFTLSADLERALDPILR